MNSTPNANRKHIAIFGKTNVGKSSLVNSICGQEIAIVSEVAGTTTDPVLKAMELIPLGPVLFIDTAGLDDKSEVGKLRIKRTMDMMKRTDFALYVMDVNNIDSNDYEEIKLDFDLLGAICKATKVPLVLHGASGLDENKIKTFF